MSAHHPQEILEFFHRLPLFPPSLGLVERVILNRILADYISLLKSRILLTKHEYIGGPLTIVLLDIAGSVLITVGFNMILESVLDHFQFGMMEEEVPFLFEIHLDFISSFGQMLDLPHLIFGGPITPGQMEFYSFLAPSTLFASIWTVLVLLSIIVLKCLLPLQRFTAWFSMLTSIQ